MGWFFGKKDKSKKGKDGKTALPAAALKKTPSVSIPSAPVQRDVVTQALINARAARERLGEETIQKLAEAIRKKQESPFEQAKMKIAQQDAERVADEILSMLETRH